MTPPKTPNRRLFLAAALAGGLMAASAVAQSPYKYVPAKDDMSVGKANAPVTVIEYGSVACPHCAPGTIRSSRP
jgi:protein-disulfide isomerase